MEYNNWINHLEINHEIKYILYKFNYIFDSQIKLDTYYNNNFTYEKYFNKKILKYKNELNIIISIIIIINQILYIIDSDCNYKLMKINPIINLEKSHTIINILLSDKFIFHNKMSIDIINNNYYFYNLWLHKDDNNDDYYNEINYKNNIYNLHITGLIYKLNICYRILCNRYIEIINIPKIIN